MSNAVPVTGTAPHAAPWREALAPLGEARNRVPNYVNGKFVVSNAQEWMDVHDPATGETIGSCPIGTAADVNARYHIALKYNGFIARHSRDELGVASNSNASLGKYWDRDWISLTLKTTF